MGHDNASERSPPPGAPESAARRAASDVPKADTPKAEGPKTPPAPKVIPRAHPRMPLMRRVLMVEIDSHGDPTSPFEAQSLDISRGGLAFLSRRMVHIGRHVLVEVPQAGPTAPRFLYGVVRHSRYLAGQGHIVGMELEPLPTTSAIMEYMAGRPRHAA